MVEVSVLLLLFIHCNSLQLPQDPVFPHKGTQRNSWSKCSHSDILPAVGCTKTACSTFTAKRKMDSENRQFEEEWTEKFAIILPPTSTRPMCLICWKTIAVMKISNWKRHYETKHRNFEETFP